MGRDAYASGERLVVLVLNSEDLGMKVPRFGKRPVGKNSDSLIRIRSGDVKDLGERLPGFQEGVLQMFKGGLTPHPADNQNITGEPFQIAEQSPAFRFRF